VTGQNLANRNVVDITIVLVSYNTGHLLDRLFSAITAAKGDLQLQIIAIDNASRDDSIAILRTKYPFVELIENKENVGFGRANNQALSHVHGRYVLLLNTDAFISPDTLVKTFRYLEQTPQTGIVGVKLIGEDGSLQPSCRFFPTPWNVFVTANGLSKLFPHTRLVDDLAWDHKGIRECDWVPGCFYMVRKEVVDQLGLFDPRFFVYYEEVDHCRRTREAGWKVTYYGDTQVIHLGGESAKADATITKAGRQIARLQVESELLYFRKHYGLFGLIASIALTACGAFLATVKNILRPTKSGQRSAGREKLAITSSLLFPTRWATRPTR
jgi:N-acetylglucosaminyl-diphospho-decaprenol L-rhamnosyltransferase